MSQFFRGTTGGGAIGNVMGTPPSTDNAIARYDGTTGLLIQNSSVLIDDNGNIDSTASYVGNTKSILLQNNDNTAGSSSKFSQLVGGTSAGDAFNEWSIGAARSYSLGVDNDDAQTFKLTTDAAANVDPSSGTSLMEVTSGGQISFPSATLTQYGVFTVGASGLLESTAVGTAGQPLLSTGAGSSPVFGALTVGGGGTNQTTYTKGDILYASAANTLAKLPIGADGEVLKVATDIPAWGASPGGSGIVYLATATAAASATLEFTALIDATYNTYMFIFDKIAPATDFDTLQIRTSTDAGVSYDSGVSDYAYAATGTSANVNNSVNAMDIRVTVGNSTDEFLNGEMILFNPSDANYTYLQGSFSALDGSKLMAYSVVKGIRKSAADVDAIQFYFSAGNITSGSIKLYGLTTPA